LRVAFELFQNPNQATRGFRLTMGSRATNPDAVVRKEVLSELTKEWRSEGRLPTDPEISALVSWAGPLGPREIGAVLGVSAQGAKSIVDSAQVAFLRVLRERQGQRAVYDLEDLTVADPDEFDPSVFIS
jgi:hypothetical protein